MSDELLVALQEVFPSKGITVPFIELKFRYTDRFGADALESVLKSLEESKILSSYEFNGNLNYKSLQDLPLMMSGGENAIPPPDNMVKDLADFLKILADKTGDASVVVMAEEFASKYA